MSVQSGRAMHARQAARQAADRAARRASRPAAFDDPLMPPRPESEQWHDRQRARAARDRVRPSTTTEEESR